MSEDNTSSDTDHFQCYHCNEVFPQKRNLLLHMRMHTDPSSAYCGKDFPTNYHLDGHIRAHLSRKATKTRRRKRYSKMTDQRRYVCNFCDKGFSLKSNLTIHIRTHTGEKPYRCTYCNLASATKYNLLSHIQTHYKEKTLKCDYCDKYFSSRKNLYAHVQIHTSTKRFHCKYCDKSSVHRSTIRVHERTHTGERPYSCTYCDKSFNHRTNLTHHVRIHTGERPFECKTCGQRFRQKHAQLEHERRHSNLRPFQCTVCWKTFVYKSSLRSHSKTHEPSDEVFICFHCSQTFLSKVSISLHMRSHNTSRTVRKNLEDIELEERLKGMRSMEFTVDPLTIGPVKVEPVVTFENNRTDEDVENVNNVLNNLFSKQENVVEDDLKSKLSEKLNTFMNKYSLKNLKHTELTQEARIKRRTMCPGGNGELTMLLESRVKEAPAQPVESTQLDLKSRLSSKLKMLLNGAGAGDGVVKQEPSERSLKDHMNSRLQKLFKNKLFGGQNAGSGDGSTQVQQIPMTGITFKVEPEEKFETDGEINENSNQIFYNEDGTEFLPEEEAETCHLMSEVDIKTETMDIHGS